MSVEPGKGFWGSWSGNKPAGSGAAPNAHAAGVPAGATRSLDSGGLPAPPARPAANSSSASAAAPGHENRRHPRFKCEGNMELKAEGSTIRTWATFSDLSASGCYVEMMTTFSVGSKLELQLGMHGLLVNAEAIVRTSYPFLGMGIEFTEMSQDAREQLDAMLNSLASASLRRGSAPTQKNVSLPAIADPKTVIDALARFFEAHTTLSLEEFVRLVETSQR